jgi:hypothetical protein
MGTIMNEIMEKMIQDAKTQYGPICLLPHRATFSECFTWSNNKLFFWFNTEDHSTHLIAEKVEA